MRSSPWLLALCSGAVALSIVAGCSALRASSSRRDAGAASDGAAIAVTSVELAGCSAVLASGACETAPGDVLHVWVGRPLARVHASFDGHPIAELPSEAVDDGTRFDLRVPGSAHALEISLDDSAPRSWALTAAAPLPEPLVAARALRAEGKADEAEARAAPFSDSPDPRVRAQALGLLARIALARRDTVAVDARFGASLEAGALAGRPSEVADDAAAWTFSLLERARFEDARAAIARLTASSTSYPEGRARGAYYEGRLAAETGQPRRALDDLRTAAALTARAGMAPLRRGVRQELAMVKADLGRAGEALDDIVALRDESRGHIDKCAEAGIVESIGWLALHVPGAPHGEPRAWLEEAVSLHKESCNGDEEIVATLGNLVLAELDRGDFASARARLAEARRAVPHPPPIDGLEWLESEGRIALGEGNVGDALRAFDRLGSRAASLGETEWERIAHERRAEALVARGDRGSAVEELEAAGRLLSSATSEVPLGEGRESYVRSRESGDELAIELLVALGRPVEALDHLRRARARVLASLMRGADLDSLPRDRRARWEAALAAYREARDAIDKDASGDWRLSAATLQVREHARRERSDRARAALEAAVAATASDTTDVSLNPLPDAAGEVTLAFTGSPRGWIGFAAERGEVRATTFAPPDPGASAAALGAALLGPFRERLAAASHVAVLSFGDARRVDVHALPIDGVPLGATVPVIYRLDRAEVPGNADARGLALVVGDSMRDLESARAETRAVEAALVATGRPVRVLEGSAATGEAVRAGLGRASLFHYAGHGRVAGHDGWESSLPLAEHGGLVVADILALPKSPRTVVLLGCNTARTSREPEAGGLGLAQAFVVAGAHEVLATTRDVGDAAAARVADAVYRALTGGADLPTATRDAARSLMTRSDTDWAAFRVIGP